MVRGKTAESIKVQSLFLPERIGAVTHYYNSQSITDQVGIGLDTQPHDDVTVHIHVGTMDGPAGATLLNSILESATDDPSAASAISGANFTSLNPATDEQLRSGAIKAKDQKRYLFLDTEVHNAWFETQAVTLDFAAVAVLGKPDSQATAATYDFDL